MKNIIKIKNKKLTLLLWFNSDKKVHGNYCCLHFEYIITHYRLLCLVTFLSYLIIIAINYKIFKKINLIFILALKS